MIRADDSGKIQYLLHTFISSILVFWLSCSFTNDSFSFLSTTFLFSLQLFCCFSSKKNSKTLLPLRCHESFFSFASFCFLLQSPSHLSLFSFLLLSSVPLILIRGEKFNAIVNCIPSFLYYLLRDLPQFRALSVYPSWLTFALTISFTFWKL